MFTGLVEETGIIERIETLVDGKRFYIRASTVCKDLKVDDSIAVNGVCLTVTDAQSAYFIATAVQETLQRSTLIKKQEGEPVNLERALSASGRIGGHWVQGHIDAVGTINNIKKLGTGWELSITLPDGLLKYCVEKGSIAIDGISLTIASLHENRIQIAIIPHTADHTIVKNWQSGCPVNIEVDIMAKYVERMIEYNQKKCSHDSNWYHSLGY